MSMKQGSRRIKNTGEYIWTLTAAFLVVFAFGVLLMIAGWIMEGFAQ